MNDDFSAKLDKLLSNPAMMAQIKSLADTMTETEGKTSKNFIRLNTDAEERRGCLKFFLAAAILLCGMYLSELFHLLEKPLFPLLFLSLIHI